MKVATGCGRIAQQTGGFSVFAQVQIRVKPAEKNELRIGEDISTRFLQGTPEAPYYEPTIRFAFRYFLEKTRGHRLHREPFAVEVFEIRTTTVDTTELSVVYATLLALSEALDINPDIVRFNHEKRELVFKL